MEYADYIIRNSAHCTMAEGLAVLFRAVPAVEAGAALVDLRGVPGSGVVERRAALHLQR